MAERCYVPPYTLCGSATRDRTRDADVGEELVKGSEVLCSG